MLRRIKLLTALSLAVCVLPPLAFSAPVMLGKITLNESPFEKFGQLFFPFQFATPPILFVLCESGVSPTGGCVNQAISDFVCVTNNQAGEGTAAMMSDLETSLSLGNIPPDFPCQPGAAPPIFLAETGKMQILSGKAGFPTSVAGLFIKVSAQSDLDPTTSVTSDTLTVSTK